MLGAIALVFSRDGNEVALAFAFAAVVGSLLVSYTRARAEALELKGDVGIGSRAERVVVIVSGLVLFAVIWFIALLVALPIGITTQEEAGEVVPGTPASAPVDATASVFRRRSSEDISGSRTL